jgi:hypothetical protein
MTARSDTSARITSCRHALSGVIQEHVISVSVASNITYLEDDTIITCDRATCAYESKGGTKHYAEEEKNDAHPRRQIEASYPHTRAMRCYVFPTAPAGHGTSASIRGNNNGPGTTFVNGRLPHRPSRTHAASPIAPNPS